ncbi:MAG: DUF952 domain-containing protein [Anaerolineae bacterium]|nr:DUF952 domain-containing protein [Anaerolineae bacterium]
MILKTDATPPHEWEGLTIRDFTAGQNTSSSVARIQVPPGARHVRAWSTRSDKFYYLISGQLHFLLDDDIHLLVEGDVGLVQQGHKFAYVNKTNIPVELLLLHTPAFEREAEQCAEHFFPEPMIYHIAKYKAWEQGLQNDCYQPAGFEAEGFIHCCEADQIEDVGNHYYRGEDDLVLLCIEPGAVQAPVRYEDLTGSGVFFPHVYGGLNIEAIQQVVTFKPNPDGTFSLPPEIGSKAKVEP